MNEFRILPRAYALYFVYTYIATIDDDAAAFAGTYFFLYTNMPSTPLQIDRP